MRLHMPSRSRLFAAGCAGAQTDPCAAPRPVEHFTLRSPGGFEEIALEGERLFGPNIEIVRYDNSYRGRVRELTVDLRFTENLIEGTIGNARTELYVERFPDGFGVRGLFGGRIGQFRMQSDRLEGRLGGRAFVLRKSEDDARVYQIHRRSGRVERARIDGAHRPLELRDAPHRAASGTPLPLSRSLKGATFTNSRPYLRRRGGALESLPRKGRSHSTRSPPR